MSTEVEVMETEHASLFKIGAVSRITNIPVDTLRIWERRYGVVTPIRSENADRLYQRDDINRLTLLKMLTDRGHAIGSIAKLSDRELGERLEIHNQNAMINKNRPRPDNAIHVALIGDVLSLQLEHAGLNDPAFCFTGLYRAEDEFFQHHQDTELDILILELPAIQEDHLPRIKDLLEKSGAKRLILIYGFTNSAAKKLLNSTDYILIHAPITVDHLHAEIKRLIEERKLRKEHKSGLDLDSKAPARAYSNKHLIQLSSMSSVIKCECPQHLSSMILKMIQFEIYSAECESRSPKDAELHALLGNMTGHARSIMERALTQVVEAEGLILK